jgi:hypothetical protein
MTSGGWTKRQSRELLADALAMAQRKAARKPQLIRDILATGTVDSSQDAKYAVVRYRAEKYKRTWLTLIEWRYLEHSNAQQEADAMIETVEANLQMTETDSWPKPPARRSRPKRKK